MLQRASSTVKTTLAAALAKLRTMAQPRRFDPQHITAEHVVWAFRLFFDREVEDQRAIDTFVSASHSTRDRRPDSLRPIQCDHDRRVPAPLK